MKNTIRINLNPGGCHDRKRLIDLCLNNPDHQFLAIGWSYVYDKEDKINNYEDYYWAVKKHENEQGYKINAVHNKFWYAEIDDLYWTRDLEGCYWICRVIGRPVPACDRDLDIGAILPVKAFKVGLEVPGQIKASFNRPNGGTAAAIKDKLITEYSKFIYNKTSKTNYYTVNKFEGGLLDNLPDFDLEELVISYLQIKENYYVLSNSIANKSTTINIECELMSRDSDNPRKAVLQVKGGKTRQLNALDYQQYIDDGYIVYLYAPYIINLSADKNYVAISKEEIMSFYSDNKELLPASITKWEHLFN